LQVLYRPRRDRLGPRGGGLPKLENSAGRIGASQVRDHSAATDIGSV